MLALVPIAFLGLLIARLEAARRSAEPDLRQSFLIACTYTGAALLVITESLSWLNALSAPAVAGGWLLGTLTVGLGLGTAVLRWPANGPRWSFEERALLVLLAAIVVVVGVTAIAAAPNTADGMTYHLSRVAHWIQNRNIDFFQTHNLRQLHLPPFAELALLHSVLLSGTDKTANLVQWGFMVASLLGISKIAAQLGAARRGQLVSALAAATLPMGVLQGSSVQNDWAVGFWMVCFVSATLRFRHRATTTNAVFAGLAFGLAALTKPTAYMFGLPFAMWSAAVIWRRAGARRRALQLIGTVLMAAVAVNASHWTRNIQLFGAPLAGPVEPGAPSYRYSNDGLSPSILLSNLARNTALHASTPSSRVNGLVVAGLEELHRWLPVELNDRRTTWPGTEFFLTNMAHEDATGNPIHLLLSCGSVLLVLTTRRAPDRRRLLLFALCLAGGLLLFCAVLRWQPWHSRLHLPLFAASSVLCGIVVARQPIWLRWTAATLLVWGALPGLLTNYSRPLLGERSVFRSPHQHQYFANRSHLTPSYLEVVERVAASDCRDVGLLFGPDDYEYPLWVLLADPRLPSGPRRLEHVAVTNLSQAIPRTPFSPCLVIAARWPSEELLLGDRNYRRRSRSRAGSEGALGVFSAATDDPAAGQGDP